MSKEIEKRPQETDQLADYPGHNANATHTNSITQTGDFCVYECFHCGCRSVIWDADFNFEDFCLEGDGIVHVCHCTNCGADIEYRIRTDEEVDDHGNDV